MFSCLEIPAGHGSSKAVPEHDRAGETGAPLAGESAELPDTVPGSPSQLASPSHYAPVDLDDKDTLVQKMDDQVQEPPKDSQDALMPPSAPATILEPEGPTLAIPQEQQRKQCVKAETKTIPAVPAFDQGGLSNGRKRPAAGMENGFEEGEVMVDSVPPEVLSSKAIYMRIHRCFKMRKDGTYLLDDKWNQAWADVAGGGRDSVFALFEKVGYERDWSVEIWTVFGYLWIVFSFTGTHLYNNLNL